MCVRGVMTVQGICLGGMFVCVFGFRGSLVGGVGIVCM